MDRHTKLLKEFNRSKTQAELLNKLSKSRKAINTGNSGTFGYRLKEGTCWKKWQTFKKTSDNI